MPREVDKIKQPLLVDIAAIKSLIPITNVLDGTESTCICVMAGIAL